MLTRFKFFIQDRRQEVVLYSLFFLVSLISFLFGYLVAQESSVAPIVIEKHVAPLW